MNLECLNDIIANNLAIQIDLTNNKSWTNYNTGLTAFSLTKWNGAVSDNINLIDFGLAGFDNGRTNIMWGGETITPKDTLFSMYRVGYNSVINPTVSQTSGITATTHYYSMSAVTTGSTNNYYFKLNGGYLQGFFKLQDYNYTLLPSRYAKGITIETIINIFPNSQGIFYMMGARAEDKYNPYYSGETITGTTISGTTSFSGITTSENNYLDAIVSNEITKKNFRYPEDNKLTNYYQASPINNLSNNVIAFELTSDKRLGYKHINCNGQIVENYSTLAISTTGITIIDIVFTPSDIIVVEPKCCDDNSTLDCAKCRTGKLVFYVNGRSIWTIKDFPEFYFHGFSNQREKQIGMPYSISWGGGSFGLKHSWHYDYQTYNIYNGQNTNYVKNKFSVKQNPEIGNNNQTGLVLSANSTTYTGTTVMQVTYTGGTGKTYFIKFNNPISVLSNRDYEVNVSILDDNFFKNVSGNGESVINKISVLAYSNTTDINIVDDIEYVYPLTMDYLVAKKLGLHPFPDGNEYEYSINGVMYYGETGLPVFNQDNTALLNTITPNTVISGVTTGQENWNKIKTVFRTNENSGKNNVYIGLLIETSDIPNLINPLHIKDFTYTASDILVQDQRKNNLLIEQNFNNSFIGGIQKLRIYDNALTSQEVLHNAKIESKINPSINIIRGGRIIGSNILTNLQWIYHVMYNNTLLYNSKIWNND